jgi:type II secretory pathway pseudopilin PulG
MRWPKTRRERQSGATLVEVLVATVIMGLALAIIVGTFSTGLLDSALAKQKTAASAVVQYELDQISSIPFSSSAQPYSDCFATEDATSQPYTTPAFQGACPSSSYTLRADVTVSSGPGSSQQWTVTIVQWPAGNKVGDAVSILKVNR